MIDARTRPSAHSHRQRKSRVIAIILIVSGAFYYLSLFYELFTARGGNFKARKAIDEFFIHSSLLGILPSLDDGGRWMAERFSGQLTALARFSLRETFQDNKNALHGGEKRARKRGRKSIQDSLPTTKTKVLLFIRSSPRGKKGI